LTEHLTFPITASGPISEEVLKAGFSEFQTLAEHIQSVPYGRPSEAGDFLSVLKENRGICSSKHRLLAALAHECGHPEVELMVGIYEMSEENTPGVGSVLSGASVVSIPEAHCYLRVRGCRYDFTGLPGGKSSPFDTLLSEQVILPHELPKTKLPIHQQAIASWAARHGLAFFQAWSLREACIEALMADNRVHPAETTGSG
jgi:hypothetical protein